MRRLSRLTSTAQLSCLYRFEHVRAQVVIHHPSSGSAGGGAQGKDKRFDSDRDHLRHAHGLANVDVVKVAHVNVVDGDDGAIQFELFLENCPERPSHVYVQHQKQGSSRR